jgi:hypothetical protein
LLLFDHGDSFPQFGGLNSRPLTRRTTPNAYKVIFMVLRHDSSP